MKRFVGSLFCFHEWEERLILGVGNKEYNDIRRCRKCGKSKVLWSGRQAEWRERHGYAGSAPRQRVYTTEGAAVMDRDGCFVIGYGADVSRAELICDALNAANAPHEPRRDSGVALDGVVGSLDGAE